MSENAQDMIARVRLMAAGTNDTWDLSDNDVLALKYVLERLEKCEAALRKLALDLGPLGKIARAALDGHLADEKKPLRAPDAWTEPASKVGQK